MSSTSINTNLADLANAANMANAANLPDAPDVPDVPPGMTGVLKATPSTQTSRIFALSTKKRRIKNSFFFGTVCFFSFITLIPLFSILFQLIYKGYKQINLDFFTHTAPSSLDALLANISNEIIPGGILNGIAGSFSMLLIACVIAIPLGICIGIYTSENTQSKYSSLIRNTADLLNGTPSIVIGMIVYAWVVKPLGSYSGLAGSIALAFLILPLVIRSTDESLKMLPSTLKEAALALGGTRTKCIVKILLPSALGGICTGILLGISRALGETAPLILTALGASVVQLDMTQAVSAIPLLIWEFYNDPNLCNLIWSSALFLMFIVLTLNLIARKWKNQSSNLRM